MRDEETAKKERKKSVACALGAPKRKGERERKNRICDKFVSKTTFNIVAAIVVDGFSSFVD